MKTYECLPTETLVSTPPHPTRFTSTPLDATPIWRPWACRNWPATAGEELAFSLELSMRSGSSPSQHARKEITAVLNALRGGLTVSELLNRAPGLRPDRLHSAYVALDELRHRSEAAWHAIVREANTDALGRHSAAAAALLPVLVRRLQDSTDMKPTQFATVVRGLATQVEERQREIERIESLLDRCVAPSDKGVRVGRQLYDPAGDGITGMNDHLSTRVGTLTSMRTAALLGERPAEGGIPQG